MTHILVYSDCGGIFGAEQVNHRLALALHDAGYRVSFAQPEARHHLVDERRARGITHYWLPPEQLYELGAQAPSLREAGPAGAIMAEARPDLVLFADGAPVSSLAAKTFCAAQSIPFIALVHCVADEWRQTYAAHLPTLAHCYRAAREVVAVSAANLRLLRQDFGLPADKGRVIVNGRPPEFFAPADPTARERLRRELGITADAVLCLSIGRMELAKGYQYQLEALRRLARAPCWPALQLLWVGTGTLQRRLLGIARLAAGGKLHHCAQRQDIPQLLAAADLLLHTPRFEGMPLVVLEAMASGLPVIATAVSGIPEALGDTGVLLGAPDTDADLPRAIADAVCSLALDAPLRARLGAAARQRAQALFREETMLQHYLELVAQITAGPA